MITFNRSVYAKQNLLFSIMLLGMVVVCIYVKWLYVSAKTVKGKHENQPLTAIILKPEEDVYYSDERRDKKPENSTPVKLDEEEVSEEVKKSVKELLSKMIPPSKTTAATDEGFEYEASPHGIVVRKLTNYKTGGFFVECGAGNSNTQFLERHLGWKGLLVEADPRYRNAILRHNRKSWFAPLCMSLNTSVYEAYGHNRMAFRANTAPDSSPSLYKVKCYPFHMFMLALNVTAVDFFSLDVEGDELDLLKTVPFDNVDITVISVAFSKSPDGLVGIKEAMGRHGYRIVSEVTPDDLIFVKKGYKIPIKV